jgi:hypothetical protein
MEQKGNGYDNKNLIYSGNELLDFIRQAVIIDNKFTTERNDREAECCVFQRAGGWCEPVSRQDVPLLSG